MLVTVIAPASPPVPALVIWATGGPAGAAVAAVVGVDAGAEVGARDGAVVALPQAASVNDTAPRPSANRE
jgi:hypothetical protein